MEQPRHAVGLISGLWLFLMLITETAFANGMPTFRSYQAKALSIGLMGVIVLATYISTAVVECAVVYLFLRGLMATRSGLFPWVLLVNLITNPVAQLVWIYFKHWLDPVDGVLLLCGIEIAVVVVEFLFFRWLFERMYHRGALAASVTDRRTLMIVLAANVASLVFVEAGFLFLSWATQAWNYRVGPMSF